MTAKVTRAARLRPALAAVLVPAHAPELALVHRWLDTWPGIGAIVVGMARQGYDPQLTEYPQGWRVNFRRRASDQVVGTGWDATPWRAVQCAAREALTRTSRSSLWTAKAASP